MSLYSMNNLESGIFNRKPKNKTDEAAVQPNAPV